jgi:hypothetical protein
MVKNAEKAEKEKLELYNKIIFAKFRYQKYSSDCHLDRFIGSHLLDKQIWSKYVPRNFLE